MVQAAATRSIVLDPREVEHDRIWSKKPTLRMLYGDYHSRLMNACPAGRVLEAGGGTAHVRRHSPMFSPSTSCRPWASIRFATRIACLSPMLNSLGSL